MRFYSDFPEAINEIRRELKEMGISVHTKSVQNLSIVNNSDYDSFELQNYTYTVTSPTIESIPLKSPEWVEAEFQERVGGIPQNPGEAWKFRREYWEKFINTEGEFDYAYPERMSNALPKVISALQQDLSTRRAFLSVFDCISDSPEDFKRRIPCTLGYWFNYRQEKLNITYLLRSSDFGEHFNYDVYLATRLMQHVAKILNVAPGTFTHWIGSLHIFQKDVADVF